MLRKMWSEMNYGLRLLILVGFGGIATASVALYSRYHALQVTSQSPSAKQIANFETNEIHSDPKLDLALHQLRKSPTLDNIVECYAMLTERAKDPHNPYDSIAWSWFIGAVGRHLVIENADDTLWEWFKSEVVSDQNPIYASATVRQTAISLLRERDEEIPEWMIRNPDDRRIAQRPPLPSDFPEKNALAGADEDVETNPRDDQ